MGIALDEKATMAWKNAREVWEAVSSRIVMARLLWKGTGKRRRKHGRRCTDTHISVVCAYAPTAKAPPGIKRTFYTDLQDTIDKIPRNYILVTLRDFNARVGVLDQGSDMWCGVLGRHEHNLAGEEFLEFCAANSLSIMNTWFQKKEIHHGTWTDHKLVRAKLNIIVPCYAGRKEKSCIPFAVHELSTSARRDEYQESLKQHLLDRPQNDDDTAERIWDALKYCIVTAAEESVGRGKRNQPEWFEENSELLVPLIEAKNEAQLKALRSNTAATRQQTERYLGGIKEL